MSDDPHTVVVEQRRAAKNCSLQCVAKAAERFSSLSLAANYEERGSSAVGKQPAICARGGGGIDGTLRGSAIAFDTHFFNLPKKGYAPSIWGIFYFNMGGGASLQARKLPHH